MEVLISALLILCLAAQTLAHSQVVYVISIEDPTYDEEYQCVVETNAEHTKYSWRRQGWKTLPEGVKAEGDRLHFLKSTPDLNGVYICEIENQLGAAAGSLYRHRIRHIEF